MESRWNPDRESVAMTGLYFQKLEHRELIKELRHLMRFVPFKI